MPRGLVDGFGRLPDVVLRKRKERLPYGGKAEVVVGREKKKWSANGKQVTLFDRKTGKPIVMPGGYDEMSDRSWPDYLGGTSEQRWHRDLLRRAMEEEGFTVYEAEWWHFDYKAWRSYGIMNKRFEELSKARP